MSSFNRALLCKQGWRLLKNTDTLAFRVLQAKYFLRKSFMDSKLGSNLFFTWQSIWATKKTLAKGIRWRVWNGRNIKVWKDLWIPKLRNFIPEPPTNQNVEDTRVNELMEEDTNQWNMEKLNDLFPAHVAEMIQEIPIATSNADDILVWSYEEKGVYNVRSGYRLLTKIYGYTNR